MQKLSGKWISISALFVTVSCATNPPLFALHSGIVDPRIICQRFNITKQPEEAVKCHEDVARYNPNSPEAQYFLGVAYVYAGEERSTRKQYQVIKDLDYGYAYLLIDAIYHLKPEWFDSFYEKEAEVINKKMRERIEHEEPTLEESAASFEAFARPQRISKELESLKFAQDALLRADLESAYRIFEDGLVSKYEEVRQKVLHFMLQHPEILEGAKLSFTSESFRESFITYGNDARELEEKRLVIYQSVAPVQAYKKARQDFESVFDPKK